MDLLTALRDRGVIDDTQLAEAKDASKPLRHLKASGAVTDEDVLPIVADARGIPYTLLDGDVDVDAARSLPVDVCESLGALPFRFTGAASVDVAVLDPSNASDALSSIETQLVMQPRAVGTTPGRFHAAIQWLRDAAVEDAETDDVGGPVENSDDVDLDLATVNKPDPAPEPTVDVNEPPAEQFDLHAILTEMVEMGGSDLHLSNNSHPAVRVSGDLQRLEHHPVGTPESLRKAIYGMLTQKQREEFETHQELDTSYELEGLARFRVNVLQQRDAIGAVMRVIPFEILSLEKLNMPTTLEDFAYMPRGLVLVTGPTGSGKSTTLASLIDLANRNRDAHIMTVEDPIEFLHEHKRALINQREVGRDTKSFNAALKHVLRQDPDVILVGEMRDLETIEIALTAAETGHLVFGTLHTQDAPQTIDRVVDVFPHQQQEQIRVMLGGALQGVVCQQLVKTVDGKRAAACEVMVATGGIKNLIREGKTHQMYSMIQSGRGEGMQTMDAALAELVKTGRVSFEAALEKANNVKDLKRLAGREDE